MRRFRVTVSVVTVAVCLSGCVMGEWRSRGQFSLIVPSGEEVDYEVLSDDYVHGEACFGLISTSSNTGIYQKAIADALEKSPEAMLLVDVTLQDEGKCVVVKGRPARERQISAATSE